MKKLLKWIGIVLVVLFVIGVIAEATKSPEEKAADQARRAQNAAQEQEAKNAAAKQERDAKAAAAKQEADSLQPVTASQLARAYEENTVAADQQFKGKKFKVTGTVNDINTDFSGDPYLVLSTGGNPFMLPHFGFAKASSDQLAKVRKGTKVTLICTGRGDVAKTPMSDDCTLL